VEKWLRRLWSVGVEVWQLLDALMAFGVAESHLENEHPA